MEIIQKPLEEIIPYENNPRRIGEDAVNAVAESIRQFGFRVPIVIDAHGVIVCGHTRYQTAQSLGLASVPCIVADDLTEEQIKAYRLADNRTSELSAWNFSALEAELDALEIDAPSLDLSAFDFAFEFGSETRGERVKKTDRTRQERQSLRRNVFENFERDFSPVLTGKYDIPVMAPTHTAGDKFLRFMDWKEKDDLSEYIAHFYVDDYTFIASWREPDKYVERLRKFRAVVQPNYSLYTDFPLALQILSCYRRQWIGAYWQSLGLDVIPCVVWGEAKSYDFCFDGLPHGGTVAVSTLSAKKDPEWNGKTGTLFLDGYNEMIRRLSPETILLYGRPFDGLDGNIVFIPPQYEQWERFRGKGKGGA